MLRPELADKVRPFSRRREAHAAAALAIGEAERGNNLHRSVLTHAVGERLQSIIKTAAVRLLAFGNGRSTAAPAGHADIKMWAGVKRNNHPVRHCRRILGCKRHKEGTREPAPGRSNRPPKLPEHPARHPGSSKRRQVSWLADFSFAAAFPGITPVANYGKLSAYSCGGSCGIRAKTRHRIPFSLLIFEETVNSASLKGAGAGLVNGDAPPADRACGGGTPVYSSGRRRFPHYERDARWERGEERKL